MRNISDIRSSQDSEKPVVDLPGFRRDIKEFPKDALQEMAHGVRKLARGNAEGLDIKPMTDIGPGVHELRIRMGRQFRVLYIAKFAEAVYLLHAFEKKSQKTSKENVDLGRARLKRLIGMRKKAGYQ